MINYLGSEQYGIWSTLLSILSWIVLFDLGVGNGLRNKISESLAIDGNTEKAQKYISTAYVAISIFSLCFLILFLYISSYISWSGIFNTKILTDDELRKVVNITASFLFVNFALSLINQVFNGIQQSSKVILNQLLSNTLSLLFVFLLYFYTNGSLIKLAFFYGLSLIITNLLISVWFFISNVNFLPRVKYYRRNYLKPILSLGLQFFVIQIAVIVIFTTDKILITQLFGPQFVVNYDVVFKIFSIVTLVHSLIVTPLWSACSDAYHREDYPWIRASLKIQLNLYLYLILFTTIIFFLTKFIVLFWIGDGIEISFMLIMSIAVYTLVSVWNNIFANFINATNKLAVQIGTSLVAIFVNIPLSIFIVKYFNTGLEGVVFGTIASLSLFMIFGPIQTYSILRKKNV